MGVKVNSITTFGSPLPLGYKPNENIRYKHYWAEKDIVPWFTIFNPGNLTSLIGEFEYLTLIKGEDKKGMVMAHNVKLSYSVDDTVRSTKSAFNSDISTLELIAVMENKYNENWINYINDIDKNDNILNIVMQSQSGTIWF